MSDDENVYMFDADDPAMGEANKAAQDSFKYFWRELSWEFRRIVPALDLACVKIAFTDGDTERDGPSHEHMWVSDVNFDGKAISGTLINSPSWLTNVSEGDSVTTTLRELGDWMFAIQGKVYGGFTVNLMRSRMSRAERKAHDDAWGLDFGDPETIDLVYEEPKKKKGLLARIFGGKEEPSEKPEVSPLVEHPMSINMGPKLVEQLKSSREFVHERDERGWTVLHTEALAGNLTSVRILIKAGADPTLKTNDGATPLDLARKLGWKHVVKFLQKRAKQ
jgi:uncharacterized protein YegJ (DUF2314 family)